MDVWAVLDPKAHGRISEEMLSTGDPANPGLLELLTANEKTKKFGADPEFEKLW